MESLNELIGLAQSILDAGFDLQAFLTWREFAFLCLLGLLGPVHYYTKSFVRFTHRPDEHGLLAGEGLLVAAREEIKKAAGAAHHNAGVTLSSSPHGFVPWMLRPKRWLPLLELRIARRSNMLSDVK